jgi:hypothetical protein
MDHWIRARLRTLRAAGVLGPGQPLSDDAGTASLQENAGGTPALPEWSAGILPAVRSGEAGPRRPSHPRKTS